MPKNPSAPAPKKSKTTTKPPAKTARKAAPGAPSGLTPAQAAVLQRLSAQAGMSTAEVAATEVMGHSTAQKALTVLEAAGLARREAGVRNGALKSPDRWFTTAPATSTDPELAQGTPQTTTDTDAPDDAADEDVAEQTEHEPDLPNGASEPADLAPATPTTASAGQGPDTVENVANDDTDESAAPDHADDHCDTDVVPNTADTANAQPDATSTKTPVAETTPTGTSGPRLGKGELRAMVEQYLRDHPEQAWTPSKIGKALGRSAGAVSNAAGKLIQDGTARTFDDAPHRVQIIPAPAGTGARRASKTSPKPAS
ncbi:MAG: MarR family transcriptional regulator [Catenulispora sp.]